VDAADFDSDSTIFSNSNSVVCEKQKGTDKTKKK
jgi:hypothetical protein